MQNVTGAGMANQVNFLLNSFCLLDKIITYVNGKGSNLNTLTNDLKFKVSCSPLQLFTPFVGSCFCHALSKEIQYATNDATVCQGFSKLSVKSI
jgi:hypothetical protein